MSLCRLYNLGDIVVLKRTMNHKGAIAKVVRNLGEDRYQVELLADQKLYVLHAIYMDIHPITTITIPAANYDGNKVVPWNSCHWKPRKDIIAGTYQYNIKLLNLIMQIGDGDKHSEH